MRTSWIYFFATLVISASWLTDAAFGQVLLSDSFERTTGGFGDPGPPPTPADSDWGMFDNALGGTTTPTTYITTDPPNNLIQSVGLDESGDYDRDGDIDVADVMLWQREFGSTIMPPGENGDGADGNFDGTVDGGDLPVWRRNFGGPFGKGEFRFGRAILDVNLATLPGVSAAGGFAVQADVSPSDTGGAGANGRDWPALMLADTNDPSVIGGPQAIANLNNDNIRFGAAPRNSGSLLQRINNEPAGTQGAGDQLFATGNPFNAGINEPIIDQPAFNNYSINYLGPNAPSPPDDFVNPSSYNVNVTVDAPNGFGSGAQAFATVTVDGNPIYSNEPFTWGDDPEDADNVYLGFVSFGAPGVFDNLILSSNGTTILSDNFNGRTTGNPIMGGTSDWGTANNNLGGSVAASYITTDAGNENQQTVEGGEGILRSGRTILDYNLATDPTILANDEFTIDFEVNPTDDGGASFNGRDWAGFALGNTNDLGNWGGSLFLPNNNNARLGFAPRNSGTMLSVARGGFGTLTDGNPSNPFNELIFDQEVFDDYTTNYVEGSFEPYINEKEYTIRIEVASDFSANAASTATVFIGEVGGPLTNVGTFDFQWGDNADEAYLTLAGNQAIHKFDNLIVELLPAAVSGIAAVPEPSALALLAVTLLGSVIGSRGRRD